VDGADLLYTVNFPTLTSYQKTIVQKSFTLNYENRISTLVTFPPPPSLPPSPSPPPPPNPPPASRLVVGEVELSNYTVSEIQAQSEYISRLETVISEIANVPKEAVTVTVVTKDTADESSKRRRLLVITAVARYTIATTDEITASVLIEHIEETSIVEVVRIFKELGFEKVTTTSVLLKKGTGGITIKATSPPPSPSPPPPNPPPLPYLVYPERTQYLYYAVYTETPLSNSDHAASVEMRIALADGSFVPAIDSTTFSAAVNATFLGANTIPDLNGGVSALFDRNETASALQHASGVSGVLFYLKLNQPAAAVGGRILSGYGSYELPTSGIALYGSNDAETWTKTADLVSIAIARNYGCGSRGAPVDGCVHTPFGNISPITHVYRFVVVDLSTNENITDLGIAELTAAIADGTTYVYPASELSFLHPLVSSADQLGSSVMDGADGTFATLEPITRNGNNIFSLETEKPIHTFDVVFRVANGVTFGVDVYRDDVLISPASSAVTNVSEWATPDATVRLSHAHTVSHFLAVVADGSAPAISEFRAGYGDTRFIAGPDDFREVSDIVPVHTYHETSTNVTLKLLFDGELVLHPTEAVRFAAAPTSTVLFYFEIPKNVMPKTGNVWTSGMTNASLFFAHELPTNPADVTAWHELFVLVSYVGHVRIIGPDPQYVIEGSYVEYGAEAVDLNGDVVAGVTITPSLDATTLGTLGAHIVTYSSAGAYSTTTRGVFTGPVGPTVRQVPVEDVKQDVLTNTPLFINVSKYFDEGGSTVQFEFSTNNNALLTVNGTGSTLGLFKKEGTQGTAIITVRAITDDAYAQPREASVDITFTVVNNAPFSALAIQDVQGPTVINLTNYFSDPDYNDRLSYHVTVLDPEIVNATVVGTILYIENGISLDGNTEVIITATDRLNATAFDTFIVTFVYVPPLVYQTTTYTDTSWTSVPLIQHATAYKLKLEGSYGGNGWISGGQGGIVELVVKLPTNAIGFQIITNVGGGPPSYAVGNGGGATIVAIEYNDGTAKTIAVAGGGGGGGASNGEHGSAGPGGNANLVASGALHGNAGGGAGPTYHGSGGGSGSSSGSAVTLTNGITYGIGGKYSGSSQYGGAGGGGGWFGGGGGGGTNGVHGGAGAGSNFVGRYNNAGSWTPHANTVTFTNTLTDQITGVTYWQQSSSGGGSSRSVTIEVGPEINSVVE
jgi:hypothetical protein